MHLSLSVLITLSHTRTVAVEVGVFFFYPRGKICCACNYQFLLSAMLRFIIYCFMNDFSAI